jgi:hypothetical protein
MIDADGAIFQIGEVSLDADQGTGWLHAAIAAQDDIDPGAHRLLIEHVNGGSAVQSTAWIDNIALVLVSPAELTDVAVAFGSLVSGGLQDLIDSDDAWLRTRSIPGFTAEEANLMELRVGAVTTVQSPSTLDLALEGRISQPGGSVRVRFRNWNTNAFVQIHQYPIGFTEAVESIEDIVATNYVRASDGRIEVSMRHSVFATFSVLGFDSYTDQVAISVQ